MIIQMLIGYSGGRYDDRPWPSLGTDFEVPDWEGEGLIRVGHARFVRASDPPAAPPAPPPPAPPVLSPAGPVVSEPAATAAGPVTPEPAPEPAPGPEPEPEPEELPAPGPADPKAAWIEYAISQGAKRDTAAAMTKADLMSRYGGRL